MKLSYFEILTVIMVMIGLVASMFMASQIWYVYLVLMAFYIILRHRNKNDSQMTLPLFFLGILSSFAIWFASPLISLCEVCLVSGLFFYQMKLIQSAEDIKLLLGLVGIIVSFGCFSIIINRTLLPFLILLGLSGLFFMLSIILEFRLKMVYGR